MVTIPTPVLPASAPSGNSLPMSSPVPVSPVAPDIDSLPIALFKDKRTYTSHHITQFVSCDHLAPSLRAFTMSVTTTHVPKSASEALFVPC